MPEPKDVAVGLLAKAHIEILKGNLPKAFPFSKDRQFDDLLKALDDVDRRQRE